MHKRMFTLIFAVGIGLIVCSQALAKDHMEKMDTMGKIDKMDSMVSGTYENYAKGAFMEAKDKTRILFFHADWCPYCRKSDEMLKKNKLPENTVVFKVDYDKAKDIRKEYNVNAQNTFVLVDSKGKAIKQWNGYESAMADHFMAGDLGRVLN